MGGYVVNFTVYTMAMIGLICFAVFVYRKITDGSFTSRNGKYLSVEETMSLSPRKTLHVVRAGSEKFLIASDIDRTTLLAKLNDENTVADTETDVVITETKPEEEILLTENQDTVPVSEQDVSEVKEEPPVVSKIVEEEHKEPEPVLGDEKIVAFEAIYPSERKKSDRRSGVRVQRKRTIPKPEVVQDYKKHNLSPIKQIAKRINEL